MIRLFAGFSLSLLLVSTALAQTAAPAADGKSLFRTRTCIACHGRDGARAIQNYPELAGQDRVYLFNQMKDIASGTRISGKDERGYPRSQGMKDIMHLVSEAELQQIADYLAVAPAPKPRQPETPLDQAALDKGKAAYTQGGCQSCHGPSGKKPLASYPTIGGMKREYLMLQMAEMRDGIRTNGKSKLMLPFAKKLNNEQIELIATYLSQIER
ncbi:MAG: c-type cytochrome [Xanthobacteraceae bacterium]|nr:MAG: c-type cytochrome [Xanthobacteraceae bacterium]